MLSIQSVVKGVHTIRAQTKPGLETLKTAENIEQIPASCRSDTTDPVLIDHFRVRALRRTRQQRLRPESPPPCKPKNGNGSARIPPGRNVIDFMASGPVRWFTSGRSVVGKRHSEGPVK